jgi:hypothetical protein
MPLFARCASAGDGRRVVVIEGWDPATFRPTRDVRVVDVAAGTRSRAQPMPESRSFFGGALAYAVAADAWCARSATSRGSSSRLAASGYATDEQGAFKNTVECYSAGGDAWSNAGDMVPDKAGRTALAMVGGKVWAIGPGKGGVREWDGAWRGVADGPPGMKACVEATALRCSCSARWPVTRRGAASTRRG